MALAGRKSVEKAQQTADQAANLRVSGGRGIGGGVAGQSISIPLPVIRQSGTVVRAYQGSWPNPIDGLGQEQFVGAYQYVCVSCDPENANRQFDKEETTLTRYWRTGYLGSGAALGITIEAAKGKYKTIPIQLMGLAYLWVEPDELVKPGERVGSQTAVQGVGNALYDHLGPSLLIRRLPHDDPLEDGRELWLVRHTCLRGSEILVCKPSTGEFRIAKTVLFNYEDFNITNNLAVVSVGVRV